MSTSTLEQLDALLREMKAQQHALIDEAARAGGSAARSDVRDIGELENAIAAVIALMEERGNDL